MKIVIIESPFAGTVEDNIVYARACLFDSITRGEAPFASHLLYTQVLDDNDPDHRTMGILAGLEIALRADLTAVYMDKGMSPGMKKGIAHARRYGRPVEERWLSRWNPVGPSTGD